MAYAPARARADWLALLALDTRLAGVVRSAREPMLAQMRLAWWRDRLQSDPAGWPRGEPVLAALVPWAGRTGALVALVDGWEALLGEPPLADAAFRAFADGRAAALAALAEQLAGEPGPAASVARQWALADLSLHLGDATERAGSARLIGCEPLPRLARPLRPLTILAGLSLRAVRFGRTDVLDGPGALLSAIRLGFVGR